MENVTESIGVHTSISGVQTLNTAEHVGVGAVSSVRIPVSIVESLAVHATSSAFSWQTTLARIGVRATSSAVIHARSSTAEVVAVRARSTVSRAVLAQESVAVRGDVSAVRIRVHAAERAAVRGVLTAHQTQYAPFVESVGVRARSSAGMFGTAIGSVGVRTQSVVVQAAKQRVVESLGVRGVSWADLISRAVVRESVGVRTVGTVFTRAVAQLSERMFVSIRSWVPHRVQDAAFPSTVPLDLTSVWTADVRSFGMSRYVGVPVSEWVEHAGVTFGVAPTGVYTRTGDAPVSWVETAKMQFQTQFDSRLEHKRLSHVYVYAQHGQPLSIMVSGDYQGVWTSHTYTQSATSANTTRAVRTPVGRGFSSNFYAFRVGSKPFDLFQFEVEMVKTSRRV